MFGLKKKEVKKVDEVVVFIGFLKYQVFDEESFEALRLLVEKGDQITIMVNGKIIESYTMD